MTRFASMLVAVLALSGLAACEKPSEDSCRKAIANMQRLMGTDNLRNEAGVQSEVRRCKGGSSKKSVECAIAADSLDALRKCDFFKVPENAKGIGGDTTPAGSAATGSAAPAGSAAGSADAGSAAGSDAAGSAGSAAGSADVGSAGSAAAGSAATGSAAANSTATGSAAAGSTATGSAASGSAAAPSGSATP